MLFAYKPSLYVDLQHIQCSLAKVVLADSDLVRLSHTSIVHGQGYPSMPSRNLGRLCSLRNLEELSSTNHIIKYQVIVYI